MLSNEDAVLSLTQPESDVGIGTAELAELVVMAADFVELSPPVACQPPAHENEHPPDQQSSRFSSPLSISTFKEFIESRVPVTQRKIRIGPSEYTTTGRGRETTATRRGNTMQGGTYTTYTS